MEKSQQPKIQLFKFVYFQMPGGSDIVYPQGCRPINEELGSDELIRRLKVSQGPDGKVNVL